MPRESRREVRVAALPRALGYLVRLAHERAKAEGLAVGPLLEGAGLSQRQIEDPRWRVAVRDQIAFLDLVADATGDDLLGVHLAQRCEPRALGLIFYAGASAATLIYVFERCARYCQIVNEAIVLELIDGRGVGVAMRYSGVSRHRDRHQAEAVATFLVRLARQLTGVALSPQRVRLVHQRARGSAQISRFFGCDVEFGASVDEVTFARKFRDLPVTRADPYLSELMVGYCDEALADRRSRRGAFRTKVENAIASLLPHGEARVGEVARQLGVSGRSLARHLASEGTTFSATASSLRRDLAHRHLADGDLSISEIAWLLGYQSVGAFSHAYKRWTGKSPSNHVRRPRSSIAAASS